MVYLLKMVIFHGYVSHNQMVNSLFVQVLTLHTPGMATLGYRDSGSVVLSKAEALRQAHEKAGAGAGSRLAMFEMNFADVLR